MATAESGKLEPVELKLEVVMLGVADVDRESVLPEVWAGGSTPTSRKATITASYN